MASFQAETGLNGSVVGGLFGSGGGQTAVAPPRTFVPEGPTTVSGAAYGSAGGGGSSMQPGTHALIAGIVSFALLWGIWLTLPR